MKAHDSLWNMFLGQDFFRKNVICLGYRSSCESNFGYTRFEYFTSTRGGFRNKVAFRICVSCDKAWGLQIYGPVYMRPRRSLWEHPSGELLLAAGRDTKDKRDKQDRGIKGIGPIPGI